MTIKPIYKAVAKLALGLGLLAFGSAVCGWEPPGCVTCVHMVWYSKAVGNIISPYWDVWNQDYLTYEEPVNLAYIYFDDKTEGGMPFTVEADCNNDGQWWAVTQANYDAGRDDILDPTNCVSFTGETQGAMSFTATWGSPITTAPILYIRPAPGLTVTDYASDNYHITLQRVRRDIDQSSQGWTVNYTVLTATTYTDTTCPYALYVTPATGLDLVPPHGLPADGYGVFHIVFSKPLRTGVFDEVHAGARTPLPAGINCNIPDVNPTQCYSDPTMPAEIAMTYTVTVYSETGTRYLEILPPTQDNSGNRLSGMVGPISPCLKAAWKDVSTTFTTSAVRFECPQNLSNIDATGGINPNYWLFTGSTTSFTEVTIDFGVDNGFTSSTVDTYDDPGGSGYKRFDFGASILGGNTLYVFTATTVSGTGGSDIVSITGVDQGTGIIPSCP